MPDRNELIDLHNDLEKSLGRTGHFGLHFVSISICIAMDKTDRKLDHTATTDD